jgi:hypothetical protein
VPQVADQEVRQKVADFLDPERDELDHRHVYDAAVYAVGKALRSL